MGHLTPVVEHRHVHRLLVDDPSRDGEGLMSWLSRVIGAVTRDGIAAVLGAASEFKEGDAAIGIAATDDTTRSQARRLLRATDVGAFERQVLWRTPLFDDDLRRLLVGDAEPSARDDGEDGFTFERLTSLLLPGDADTITRAGSRLSSEAIAVVVKLLSNAELVQVSAAVGHTLPGGTIGARDSLGARLQPNSPTDHPDDIRWQVFCGWSYGVGDVLLGTNPVSSEVESVARVERTLQEIIETFVLGDVLPHCVLAHIDVQAEVEKRDPGSTALWFQSIAGSDPANRTFDVTVSKLLAHAASRTGPFALYFETGQGADCTNGHAQGVDMVVHESRKYGLARALSHVVDVARRGVARTDPSTETRPWLIVNDVAGFIGPEVFRTREQLVRCCLEDLVMGKLHGLTIGLDVCATLHMDISLDDLDWCLQQVLPARPAYLMALPTKVDPMLGYLSTGFQDHVRLRQQFGLRINPPMQQFFERLGVLNAGGGAGPHFGDPLHVYVAWQHARGDGRTDAELRDVGRQEMAAVRARGVFLAEGRGERACDLAPELDRQIREICDEAKLAFWATLPDAFVESVPGAVLLETRSSSREDYLLHPTTGEWLSERSSQLVDALRQDNGSVFNVQVVVSDGLNPLSISTPGHVAPFIAAVRDGLAGTDWRMAPETCVIRAGRVRAGYRLGEALFGGRRDQCAIVHLIGERPGTGHNTFSAYVTVAPGLSWSSAGTVDHDITQVVSGMATTALRPEDGAGQVVRRLLAWAGSVAVVTDGRGG